MKKIIVITVLITMSLFAEVINFEGLKYQDLEINDNARCPAKNVLLKDNKDFIGFIQYNDGKRDVVSSPKYTLGYMLENGRKNYKGIYKVYLTDYKTKQFIDAAEAYYVFGSNILTVGGDDVIPFRLEEDAKAFKEKHKASQIYRHDRMNKRFLDYLDM